MRPPRYYAIRVHNMVILRRSLTGLRKVTSSLLKSESGFQLKQVTFCGGIVLGVLPYTDWCKHGGPSITSYVKIERALARSMEPLLLKKRKRHGRSREAR